MFCGVVDLGFKCVIARLQQYKTSLIMRRINLKNIRWFDIDASTLRFHGEVYAVFSRHSESFGIIRWTDWSACSRAWGTSGTPADDDGSHEQTLQHRSSHLPPQSCEPLTSNNLKSSQTKLYLLFKWPWEWFKDISQNEASEKFRASHIGGLFDKFCKYVISIHLLYSSIL